MKALGGMALNQTPICVRFPKPTPKNSPALASNKSRSGIRVCKGRSNNQNRDATPGQKAMAFAMQFPAGTPGKRTDLLPESKKLTGYEQKNISNARYVLRNNPPASNSQFPQYALDVMAGLMTLTEAYEDVQPNRV